MVRELSTGKERQLTSDKKNVDEVIWAMNDEILFTSNKSGQTNLWMIPSGGGEATQVTQGGVPIGGARISADNRTLVYVQQDEIAHVWISSIDGSNAHQVTSADIRAKGARFSPDGKHIALMSSDVDPYNRETHLYVMDRDGKNQRQLTSGSEIVWACNWSPDGKWLAYSCLGVGELDDSSRVYLIQPLNPGSPRMLCNGYAWWRDNGNLHIFWQMKNRLYSIKSGTSTQLYQDSTWARPIRGTNQMVFNDFRKGGLWVVPVDSLGRQKGEAKRVNLPDDAMGEAFPPDLRFFIYRRGYEGHELWRTWTSTGKEERIGNALPGATWMDDVSLDGKEILWISRHYPAKLVLVKNVFE